MASYGYSAAPTATYNSRTGTMTYNGKTYSKGAIQQLLAKTSYSNAQEANAASQYKRLISLGKAPAYTKNTAGQTFTVAPKKTSIPATRTFAGSALNSANKNIGKIATPVVTAGKPKPTPTPGGGLPGGGLPGGGGGGGLFSGSNMVSPTMPTYKMRTDDELRAEASTAAASIYNPIMNALRQRQEDYEKARQLGRTDLAEQYANQIADLKALKLSAESAMKEQQTSANQMYEQGQANLAQSTLNARNTNTQNYDELQNRYTDQLGQLGIANQVNPNETAMLRDKNWSDAMLQGIGNIGQTGMEAGQSAANSAMAQLIANNASQFGSLQGQAGIMKDQGMRDLDMQTLQNVMQGNVDIGKTQSDWNSKAYELMKALQATEWGKYTEANNMAFQQGATNAQLGIDAANAANQSAASMSANLNPGQLGTQVLQSSIAKLSPDKQKGFMDVWNLMLQPGNIVTANQSTPFGTLATGPQPSLTDFVGDPQMANRKDDAYKRAWLSLASRGLVSNSATDPNWIMFRDAMQAAMTGNKNYNLSNINQF